MRTYTFSFTVSPPAVDDETIANRLHSKGCDDALFAFIDGTYELEFDREASTLQEAVQMVKDDVADAGLKILELRCSDKNNSKVGD